MKKKKEHTVTRKMRRPRHTVDSSSSVLTAPSALPTDVLALGKHICRELALAGERDTLASWMAHHLADTLQKVEAGKADASDAQVLILQLWEHRRSLPGSAWPLNDLSPVILALETLKPDANPWSARGDAEVERLGRIYDGFIRVIIGALMLKNDQMLHKAFDPDAIAALPEDERTVAQMLADWMDYLRVRSTRPQMPRFRVVTEKSDIDPSEDVPVSEDDWRLDPVGQTRRVLIRTVASLVDDLGSLKADLSAAGQEPVSAARSRSKKSVRKADKPKKKG